MPPVRLELTTFRLWDWRAANCAKEALIHTRFNTCFYLCDLHVVTHRHTCKYTYIGTHVGIMVTCICWPVGVFHWHWWHAEFYTRKDKIKTGYQHVSHVHYWMDGYLLSWTTSASCVSLRTVALSWNIIFQPSCKASSWVPSKLILWPIITG